MTDQDRVKRALRWLDDIAAQVKDLLVNDYIFREILAVIRANQKLHNAESILFVWIQSVYAHSAAAGVRRQADLDNKSISLHRFLIELQEHPYLVTREYNRNLYKHFSPRVQLAADRAYDGYVGPGRKELDPAKIQKDIDLLTAVSKRIRHYTDRIVAHRDQRGLNQQAPTFHDLSKCLLEMDELVLKYLELMKGEAKKSLLLPLADDWKEIFRIPWIEGAPFQRGSELL